MVCSRTRHSVWPECVQWQKGRQKLKLVHEGAYLMDYKKEELLKGFKQENNMIRTVFE